MATGGDREARLAAAARALAAAEGGPVGTTPGAGPGRARSGRSRRGSPPPAPDPTAAAAEPDPHDVARTIVLRQLTGSPKSRSQLEDVLRRRNCPDDVAATVLDRLEEVGLVDDAAYAQTLVRSRRAGRGLARRALAEELRKKGVGGDAADAALADIHPDDERERARELVDRRLRTMHGLDRTVQTRRLAGMLARKGYSTETAFAVVREALDAAPEHRRD